MNDSNIILVTGAAKSGKSEWAEYLSKNNHKPVIYIATAQKIDDDEEWMLKIRQHQERRPKNWQIWEIPVDLPLAIEQVSENHCILIDSLGPWVANCLEKDESNWQIQVEKLMFSLENTSTDVILVAEETGWGVIPAYPLGRLFRNRLGEVIRLVGSIAKSVYLTVGGYAVDITKIGVKLPSPHC
ncbi:bifunctional adenosylcobinamide kinase/adenosylcobinamide-phosphate guanylyltransferase [Geminocystis sp. GBBB08]|uniref:bifunctional adenosylcobinamide kinase/adenosylcobinamide-phosphate guanylyltransferase n=1 Tax=Geminocystis sp. GBBB08 TaxID=2604140 RepID=UPI0027E293DF|nr:bifunctional adenosylcobinamide kinase/adenosylcobinamide-phosphate guanylyltransferase [Geminocystis sp. GBBB08]MBL1210793.1 bifunctional adenosylcobinamide kinase/adenosylcobinamide-phosphate guanylyltransferase [Geminocystis sp. GBBB08]